MRAAGLVAYVAFVAAGAALITARADRSFDYTAEVDLPENHRIRESDLRAPDLTWALSTRSHDKSEYVGQYLDRNVPAGTPVKREYVRLRPRPYAAKGTETFSWYLRDAEKAWLRTLNVGWALDLCESACPVMAAPVLAVECSDTIGTACAVVLQLTPEQKVALLAYPRKDKLLISVSRAPLGETR